MNLNNSSWVVFLGYYYHLSCDSRMTRGKIYASTLSVISFLSGETHHLHISMPIYVVHNRTL